MNRYIWLLNIFLNNNSRLTFAKISQLWSDSYLGDGTPLSLRTFHQHRKAIEELFGVEIKCNPNGYHYFINNSEALRNDRTRKWLLNSFSLSNMIIAGHNMNGKIIFEEIPKGIDYIQPLIEAIQQNRILEIDYQKFGGERKTYCFEPYVLKVYRQRWYTVGNSCKKDKVIHLALDRILDLKITDNSFTLPKKFDAEKYYQNVIGVYVNEDLTPQKVRIRVYGKQVEYLRTLPLHHSQEEVITKINEFSEFQYKLSLTPELSTHILAMGEKVEVLEPQELRNIIKKRLEVCLTNYNK